MYHILVVEDQKELNDILCAYIRKAGYESTSAFDGFQALNYLSENKYHLIILDIMLPGINGYEVLKNIRIVSDVPVILLTAKNLEEDVIEGFRSGADDYVTKPYSNQELMLRVKVLLKRTYGKQQILKYKDLSFVPEKMQLNLNGEIIVLTSHENAILDVFFKHIGHVLTRDQIIEQAFGDIEGYNRTVDSAIKRLRHKIETDTKNPEYIKTKYGMGYMFGGPDDN